VCKENNKWENVGYVLYSLHETECLSVCAGRAGGLEGGAGPPGGGPPRGGRGAPPNFFFQADIFPPGRHIFGPTFFRADIFPGPHDIRWFFGTWFLPMVFYFRLRN
jgi:hypothetical protein